MRVNFDNIPGYIKKEISSPKKVVRQGSKGHFPLRIQEWLHYHDFSTAIDSDYGPATVSQVKAFQDAQAIRATGTVNSKTWEALVNPMLQALEKPSITIKEALTT